MNEEISRKKSFLLTFKFKIQYFKSRRAITYIGNIFSGYWAQNNKGNLTFWRGIKFKVVVQQ